MSSKAAAAMYPELAKRERAEDQRRQAEPRSAEAGGKPTWATSSDPMWSKPQHEKVAIPDQWLSKIGLIKVR